MLALERQAACSERRRYSIETRRRRESRSGNAPGNKHGERSICIDDDKRAASGSGGGGGGDGDDDGDGEKSAHRAQHMRAKHTTPAIRRRLGEAPAVAVFVADRVRSKGLSATEDGALARARLLCIIIIVVVAAIAAAVALAHRRYAMMMRSTTDRPTDRPAAAAAAAGGGGGGGDVGEGARARIFAQHCSARVGWQRRRPRRRQRRQRSRRQDEAPARERYASARAIVNRESRRRPSGRQHSKRAFDAQTLIDMQRLRVAPAAAAAVVVVVIIVVVVVVVYRKLRSQVALASGGGDDGDCAGHWRRQRQDEHLPTHVKLFEILASEYSARFDVKLQQTKRRARERADAR